MKRTDISDHGQETMPLTFPDMLSKNQQMLVSSIVYSACSEKNITKPVSVMFRLRRELHRRVIKAWSDHEGNACFASLMLTSTAEPMCLQYCADCLDVMGKSSVKRGRK